MSTQRVRLMVPSQAIAPRGAMWAARAFEHLHAFGRSLWQGLEAIGQRRAANELRAMADRWQPFEPELARRLRDASEFDTSSG
jgi:hypothetical protein